MCKLLLLILALFFPPLAVLLDRGCNRPFWINCLLTLLFFIPGVIHAFIVILGDKHHHHHHHGHHDHHDSYHHQHHHDDVVVIHSQGHYVSQPAVIGQGVQIQPVQPLAVGQGVVSYQSQPVYPNAS